MSRHDPSRDLPVSMALFGVAIAFGIMGYFLRDVVGGNVAFAVAGGIGIVVFNIGIRPFVRAFLSWAFSSDYDDVPDIVASLSMFVAVYVGAFIFGLFLVALTAGGDVPWVSSVFDYFDKDDSGASFFFYGFVLILWLVVTLICPFMAIYYMVAMAGLLFASIANLIKAPAIIRYPFIVVGALGCPVAWVLLLMGVVRAIGIDVG